MLPSGRCGTSACHGLKRMPRSGLPAPASRIAAPESAAWPRAETARPPPATPPRHPRSASAGHRSGAARPARRPRRRRQPRAQRVGQIRRGDGGRRRRLLVARRPHAVLHGTPVPEQVRRRAPVGDVQVAGGLLQGGARNSRGLRVRQEVQDAPQPSGLVGAQQLQEALWRRRPSSPGGCSARSPGRSRRTSGSRPARLEP